MTLYYERRRRCGRVFVRRAQLVDGRFRCVDPGGGGRVVFDLNEAAARALVALCGEISERTGLRPGVVDPAGNWSRWTIVERP